MTLAFAFTGRGREPGAAFSLNAVLRVCVLPQAAVVPACPSVLHLPRSSQGRHKTETESKDSFRRINPLLAAYIHFSLLHNDDSTDNSHHTTTATPTSTSTPTMQQPQPPHQPYEAVWRTSFIIHCFLIILLVLRAILIIVTTETPTEELSDWVVAAREDRTAAGIVGSMAVERFTDWFFWLRWQEKQGLWRPPASR